MSNKYDPSSNPLFRQGTRSNLRMLKDHGVPHRAAQAPRRIQKKAEALFNSEWPNQGRRLLACLRHISYVELSNHEEASRW